MEVLSGSLLVIAVVDFAKRLQVKDYQGAAVIIGAGVVGYAAGFLGIAGLTTSTGLVAGFNAVGIHRVATKLGGQ